MRYHTFQYGSLEEYNERTDLEELLMDSMGGSRDYAFLQAVEEAVNNAVEHSLPKDREKGIHISVRIMETNVAVTIESASTGFDVLGKQSNILELAADLDRRHYNPFSHEKEQLCPCMGLWLILAGSDYVYISMDGKSITMMKSIFSPTTLLEIGILSRRFFIKDKEGCLVVGKESDAF